MSPSSRCFPPELLEEIFQYLSPHTLARRHLADTDFDDLDEKHALRWTLAICARVCRTFHEPAVKVLWKEHGLVEFLEAVLLDEELDFGTVKMHTNGEASFGGVRADDDSNEDMAAVICPLLHPYTYRYLLGPISAKDWSCFVRYAPFVRVLTFSKSPWTIDPTVFMFLQQHARGKPLFPNLRELIWEHATPDLVSVISPSIRILRLPEDVDQKENGHEVHEYAYRTRRHALKLLLPIVLKGLPDLEELELRSLGHEHFWHPLTSEPSDSFLCQGIHTLHIYETRRALVKAALGIVSTIKGLLKLKITIAITRIDKETPHKFQSVVSFANLRFLQLDGPLTAVRNLVYTIVALELEGVDLVCAGDLDDNATEGDVLYATFDILRRRNATSLRRLRLTLLDVRTLLFSESATTGAQSSSPGGPLLELRRLQEIEMVLFFAEDIDGYCQNFLALVEAWPMLRVLALPGLVASPETFQRIARTHTGLQSLTVQKLSPGFVISLPPSPTELDSSSRNGSGGSSSRVPTLREICIKECFIPKDTTEIDRVAYFFDSLFPQLDAERSSVPCLPKESSWSASPALQLMEASHDVTDKLKKLQLARQDALANRTDSTEPSTATSSKFSAR